ncbi:conserved hypothetical protein [Histoplasma capsulatum G186AR]|uniref:Phosphatidate phosphatase APP1 catalytic domain-containing protein n=2 Tax=Ajellomyces capsulatus TaxID=5037 RepID=C0NGF8_AJECG|nr:uncharacterized protein HCBG_02430 [Histoplasma capsulatum G186AR]EEH08893.1 conserved hypothetical protein [Histoplasma capsulatum G186AR]KAG5303789.1 hypothetical protein I7I52_01903 [Histoplasma capsulatum]QSS69387.1 hypothetical protein I7I50_10665 [Histoplasma capsulatum G186AR]
MLPTPGRRAHETQQEQETRSQGDFDRVENDLAIHSSVHLTPFLGIVASLLGKRNPLANPANPEEHRVWLLDNTAYRAPGGRFNNKNMSWEVEIVACIFIKRGREEVGKFVATIADAIGLDGEFGLNNKVVRDRMTQRVQPFVDSIAPARSISLDIPITRHNVVKRKLKPSNSDGIISQTARMDGADIGDGTVIRPSLRHWTHKVSMDTEFASPTGWLMISDVDDTIKYTQTSDAVGILRTTFAEEPRVIAGMPRLYEHIDKELAPTWFYLSSSPYNLYPFLRSFLRQEYPPGTLMLRNHSWMDLSGLLKSFTKGTQAYKVDRMEKLYRWFPKRRVICIGDSTQSDPEAYAEIYRRHKQWVRAIYIRRVTDVANMEEKNKEKRFLKAFEGVPDDVWRVFDDPVHLYREVDMLQRED